LGKSLGKLVSFAGFLARPPNAASDEGSLPEQVRMMLAWADYLDELRANSAATSKA
jgi:hypothetical protein